LEEMVNSVAGNCRRKKSGQLKGSRMESSDSSQENGEASVEGEFVVSQEVRAEISPVNAEIAAVPDDVIPISVPEAVVPNSGINFILGDEALEDVDGFVLNSNGPEAKRSEAEVILEIQTDLGLNFREEKEATMVRLMELEVRDRAKMAVDEEVHGFQ
jgi:hypothetical protein